MSNCKQAIVCPSVHPSVHGFVCVVVVDSGHACAPASARTKMHMIVFYCGFGLDSLISSLQAIAISTVLAFVHLCIYLCIHAIHGPFVHFEHLRISILMKSYWYWYRYNGFHRYANAGTGVVHMFHSGLWGNWQFQLTQQDLPTTSLLFSHGGYQVCSLSEHHT